LPVTVDRAPDGKAGMARFPVRALRGRCACVSSSFPRLAGYLFFAAILLRRAAASAPVAGDGLHIEQQQWFWASNRGENVTLLWKV
jgi:hypothetical protein